MVEFGETGIELYEFCADYFYGHQSQSILFRYAHNLLSVRDPTSNVTGQHYSGSQLDPQAKQFAC